MIARLRRWWFNFTAVVTLALTIVVVGWMVIGASLLVGTVLDMMR